MSASAETGADLVAAAARAPARAAAPSRSRRARHHARHRRRRGLMGVPALLGARDDVQAGVRDRAARACSSGRSTSPSRTTFTCCSQTKIGFWYVNSLITSAAVTVIVVDDGRGRRLRDLAARLSRPALLLVDDPGELHGADPGADRQPFHPDEPVRPHQHAGRASSGRSSSRRSRSSSTSSFSIRCRRISARRR